MAAVTVDVNIEEFDLGDILNHLDNILKCGWNFEREQLIRWIRQKNSAQRVEGEEPITLFETQKIAFFNENFDKITMEDLENIVNNK